MSKKLIIVESPGKIKKITEYAGEGYLVKASFGHCLDLDKKTLSIDVENNFKPTYVVCEGKQPIISEFKKLAKEYEIILASDEGREGEAIAWFLQDALKLKNPKRIVFHEITKKAIQSAIENPREINMNMVYAQQARRLLDRLVGYKISPLLWKQYGQNAQSAGRVQSVVVKIIIDKEEEIKKSLSEAYFKSVVNLTFGKYKINGLLENKNELYKFDSLESAKKFLEKINSNSIFKVIDIQEKKSVRKPSPPFITSSLQQEASTKLRFGVQKTMQVAQKLYEAGLITYMRTDSTCLSKDAINDCKDYIIKTFGEEYSKPVQYNVNKEGAQEAHEAIRPTKINVVEIDLGKDETKLYDLIWRKTIASQMSPAQLTIQILKIDTLNTLPENTFWVSQSETIDFDGYLAVYNDKEPDPDDAKDAKDSDEQNKKIKIKVNDILTFDNIKISQEYTKLPLRYNEAGLVKYLEKNNIGRPSTYASIINKIIERNYVEIKDIEGIKAESQQLILDKKYKIKETVNTVTLGKENKKIVPTDIGNQVNNFMVTNFNPIMQVQFTSEFEKYLDMIAEGKAKYHNILDKFYKLFEPMVTQLNSQVVVKTKNNEILIGLDPETNQEIWQGTGKYGDYLRVDKKYTSINSDNINDTNDTNDTDKQCLSLKSAIQLLSNKKEYPKDLGKYNKKTVYLCQGKFGFYFKYGDANISFNQEDINKVDVEYFKNIQEAGDKYALKTFKVKDTVINVKNGKFGPYLQLLNSKKKVLKNIPIPKDIEPNDITINEIIQLIQSNK
jgi:DNA topoisomerase-1